MRKETRHIAVSNKTARKICNVIHENNIIVARTTSARLYLYFHTIACVYSPQVTNQTFLQTKPLSVKCKQADKLERLQLSATIFYFWKCLEEVCPGPQNFVNVAPNPPHHHQPLLSRHPANLIQQATRPTLHIMQELRLAVLSKQNLSMRMPSHPMHSSSPIWEELSLKTWWIP